MNQRVSKLKWLLNPPVKKQRPPLRFDYSEHMYIINHSFLKNPLQFTPGIWWWNVKWNTATNINRLSYSAQSQQRTMTSVLPGNLHKNSRRGTVIPTPRKLPLKPWLPSHPGRAGQMTFITAGISVSVTHATSGRRWEWRGRRGRAPSFGPGHPELSGGFRAALRGKKSSPIPAAAARPEPEVPRVPIAPARPGADRQFRPGPPYVSLRLAAAYQPGVFGPIGPTSKPQPPDQAVTAGGLGRMRRHA